MVFDLLCRAGRDQTKRPLRERRARLEATGRVWGTITKIDTAYSAALVRLHR